jgi:hypothetical protein
MTRFVDRGAVFAAYVGIGMAVTIGLSFLLVIPIEPIIWLLAPISGVMIGYYANQRSDRRAGPWNRILRNALYAGLVTALTFAIFLVVVKALFFFADNGYRDPSQGGQITCTTGADCVYRRYLDQEQTPDLAAAGVTDAASFTAFYWNQQFQTALTLIVLCTGGALVGGLIYGATRPKGPAAPRVEATAMPGA